MDNVYRRFLEHSHPAAQELANESDVLDLYPVWPHPPAQYLYEFHLPYLRRGMDGLVEVVPGPIIGALIFPETYLRSTDPHLSLKVVSMRTPGLLHPNVRGSVVCLGAALRPGTSIQSLLWNLWEILSYQNVTLDERNAMNPEACRLLRACPDLLYQLPRSRFLRSKQPLHVHVEGINP